MFSDPTPAVIDSLRPDVAELAVDCFNELRVHYGLPIIATSGRRSPDEQAVLVKAGKSRTQKSFHVSGQAFDVDIAHTDRNAVSEPTWSLIAGVFEGAGFLWGGRWTSFVDKGHFEYH